MPGCWSWYQIIDSCSKEGFNGCAEVESGASGKECSSTSSSHTSSNVLARFLAGRVFVGLGWIGGYALEFCRIIEGHIRRKTNPS